MTKEPLNGSSNRWMLLLLTVIDSRPMGINEKGAQKLKSRMICRNELLRYKLPIVENIQSHEILLSVTHKFITASSSITCNLSSISLLFVVVVNLIFLGLLDRRIFPRLCVNGPRLLFVPEFHHQWYHVYFLSFFLNIH